MLTSLDQLIAGRGAGGSLVVVLLVALVLGLRHATDPDHLVAVSTLVASEPERPARSASRLGLAWGGGHATTLLAIGMPIVAVGFRLPEAVGRGAEVAIGVLIVALAIRLLRRWRHGHFHAHTHAHGPVVHRHLHAHETPEHAGHRHVFVRSPLQAYAIGFAHGTGGSAAVTILLLAAIPARAEAAAALVVFAVGAAISMGLLSSCFGYALGRDAVRRRAAATAPVLGGLSLVFGVWYALQALG